MWASGAQWLCDWRSLALPFWRTRTTDGPMAESVLGQDSPFGIDDVSGVMGIRPGVLKVFPGKYFADVLACSRVVNHHITFLGETDAHDQMAIWTRPFASQTVVTHRDTHWQALRDPILQFG